jgi:hypothetical protein
MDAGLPEQRHALTYVYSDNVELAIRNCAAANKISEFDDSVD